NLQSSITFNATGLTMYKIAIDGFNNDSGDTTLHWNLVANTPNAAIAMGVYSDKTGALMPDAPATLSYSFLPEGEFQLGIAGSPQQKYQIERSCDLIHWQPLAPTVADISGHAWFTDKSSMRLKSGTGDPICGSSQTLGLSLTPTESRF